MSGKLSFERSIPIVRYEKKRWKAKLEDNIYMVMDVGTHHGYCVLQFIDNDGDYLDVPTCFTLYYFSDVDDEDNYKIVPVVPGQQFYILMFTNCYEFKYSDKTSTLNRIERWFGAGEHVWTCDDNKT
jgi:hypothetical protein